MASRGASAAAGRRARRPDDARADWDHAGIEPPPCSRVQFGPQAASLGKAKAQEGPMTVFPCSRREVAEHFRRLSRLLKAKI
jgi:hypothetical protein